MVNCCLKRLSKPHCCINNTSVNNKTAGCYSRHRIVGGKDASKSANPTIPPHNHLGIDWNGGIIILMNKSECPSQLF